MKQRIKFDAFGDIKEPTIVLATKSGRKLGSLPAYNVVFKDNMNSYSEVSFAVNKYDNGAECRLWSEIRDFRLVYCPEWDLWFEITVNTDDGEELIKNITGQTVCEAETSQIMLYNIEINTENDIARDDYVEPTVIYNEENKEISLLDRIMEKLPHYTIKHVDSSIAEMQRTFTFDGTSFYDACQEVAEEVKCLFVFNSNSSEDGLPAREVYVYDLLSRCIDCGNRKENMLACPECGGTNIEQGYGEDSGVFVSTENLADDIQYSTNAGSIKNCFKIEGGDDLITATVRNYNPNGTDYIWHISDFTKEDMSPELVEKIESYDTEYSRWCNDEIIPLDDSVISDYNSIAKKYAESYLAQYDVEIGTASSPIRGYSSLMNLYYDVIDLSLFLRSSMMPNAGTMETTAIEELDKLTADNLSPVAVTEATISQTIADNAVLGLAKVSVDPSYIVRIENSALEIKSWNATSRDAIWKGRFRVVNINDDEDYAVNTTTIIININSDVEYFITQKMEKALKESDSEITDLMSMFECTVGGKNTFNFKYSEEEFEDELKKYSLNCLSSIGNSCQGCMDILVENGFASEDSLSYSLYEEYYNRLVLIQAEIAVREDELIILEGDYDEQGILVKDGIDTQIIKLRDELHDRLSFEKYIGDELWQEFCIYRREDKYSNSNYISDGLNNAEMFEKAKDLYEKATEELYKSAELQHNITGTLKNIFSMKEFDSLHEHFAVGSWIRVRVDKNVYKLRLLSYEINYSDLLNSTVEFSNVLKILTGTSDVQSILQQASSMASSYSSVKHQASQGATSNKILNGWVTKGLSLTNSHISNSNNQELLLDSSGFLMREWLPITETYTDKQLKIINKGLYITDDGWKTAKAGIGEFIYYDYDSDKNWTQYVGHGVIADTLVGSLILGERMGIYTTDNNIHMDKNGLTVTNGTNTVSINPNKDDSVFTIFNRETQKFYINNDGDIYMDGSIYMDGGLVSFRDSSKSTLMEITSNGQTFYGEDTDGKQIAIGTIGDTFWNKDESAYGLGFNSERSASFMSWGVWKDETGDYGNEESGYYDTVMLYIFPDKTLTAEDNTNISEGLNFFTPVRMNWNTLHFNDHAYACSTTIVDSNSKVDGYGVEFRLPYEIGNKNSFAFSRQQGRNGWGKVLEISQRNNITAVLSIYNNTYIDVHDDIHMNGCNIENVKISERSDARLKTNISDCEKNAVDILNQIDVKSFDWIESGEHESVGLIAQQLEDIIPELVLTNEDTTMKSIYFTKLIPYLIKAVQELSEKKGKKVSRNLWVDSMKLTDKEKFIREKNKKLNSESITTSNNSERLVRNRKFITKNKKYIGGKNDSKQ